MEQVVIKKEYYQDEIKKIFAERMVQNVFLVCGHSAECLNVYQFLKSFFRESGIQFTVFHDFISNPDYESIKKGIAILQECQYDFMIAIGGGSAMDVAKCIKTGCRIKNCGKTITYQKNTIPFLAVPTTAGTGSEATQFAVIYHKGEKISAACDDMLPQYILLDGSNLNTLPLLQKRAALADALCHAIESYWSVHATAESRGYASAALQMILSEADNYFLGKSNAQDLVLQAANLAGKAINISQTTAAHAMSYKLTSMWHIPHGQAVFLCLPELWEYMDTHKEQCIDKRGETYLEEVFIEIAKMLKCSTVSDAVAKLKRLRKDWELDVFNKPDDETVQYLAQTVNTERLGNTPVGLSLEDLRKIYSNIPSR